MSLVFKLDQQPTSQEIEAEKNRLEAKIKKQKIIVFAATGAIIVTLVALYWSGFVSWKTFVAAVSASAFVFLGAGSGIALTENSVFVKRVAFAIVGSLVGVGIGTIVVSFVFFGGLVGIGALATTIDIVSAIAGALVFIGLSTISFTLDGIKINGKVIAFLNLNDFDVEHCDEAVDIRNKYPQINEYCNKVVDQGRKLTKGEFKAMEAWATQLEAKKMEDK